MSATIPSRLAAPRPSWTRRVDVAVLGSGAAALAAAIAARPNRSVLIITKDTLDAGSTAWAQGGLAAVLDPTDSLEDHVRDTLAAGAGLCDEDVVRELVTAAPGAIRSLIRLGATFDRSHGEAGVALTMEGGHSHRRIVHAGGDRSGAEVQRTLDESALAAGAELLPHAFALDLIVGTDAGGQRRCAGATIAITDARGAVRSVGRVLAHAVVLATGGYGQVFASTSNPPAITGDGLALALRAGLAASDLEFVQFHPTVLWRGAGASGQHALVSEAVRGEGAVLYDAAGERVMAGTHPMDDLAPRDVVASAISARMAERAGGVSDHVFLDATHMGERFYRRFPSITASCRSAGVDPARERIPVAPAAHYACGGVRADLDGRTELTGLYAVGEVACTGVHGANRLASNSLTEGIVAGTRAGRALAAELPSPVRSEEPPETEGPTGLLPADLRDRLRAEMSRHAGVLRSAEGLASARAAVDRVGSRVSAHTFPHRSSFEATNLLTVASALLAAAHARVESRGCHRRTDFPEPCAEWRRHSTIRLDDEGSPVVTEPHPRSRC